MKPLLALLFLGSALSAAAQTSTYSSTYSQINDDEKRLSIQINGQHNGQSIAYSRTFDVRGLNKAQKDAIKSRVLDSLGLGETPPPSTTPRTPLVEQPETVTFVCPDCTGKYKLQISGNGINITQESDRKKAFPLQHSLQPGDYQYVYWQNGVKQMQLPFTVKAGETNNVTIK